MTSTTGAVLLLTAIAVFLAMTSLTATPLEVTVNKARGHACHSFGWSARPRHSQAQELSSPARDEIEEEAVNGLATEGTEVISCGLGGVQTLLILSAEIDGVGVSQGRCKKAR